MFTPLHMLALALLLLSTPMLVTLAFAQATPQSDDECIVVSDEALFRGFGYDHIVYLRNICEQPMTCEVSTDVQPDTERVQVAPAAVAMVLTFRGSPASTFQPVVTCERAH